MSTSQSEPLANNKSHLRDCRHFSFPNNNNCPSVRDCQLRLQQQRNNNARHSRLSSNPSQFLICLNRLKRGHGRISEKWEANFDGWGGISPPIRMGPPHGPWTGGLRVARRRFGAPEPLQERSKNPSIFQSNFQPILVAFWVLESVPKPSRITTNR